MWPLHVCERRLIVETRGHRTADDMEVVPPTHHSGNVHRIW